MIDYVTIVSTVGFPIAMCIWLMGDMKKVINNNTKAITEVKVVMENCRK